MGAEAPSKQIVLFSNLASLSLQGVPANWAKTFSIHERTSNRLLGEILVLRLGDLRVINHCIVLFRIAGPLPINLFLLKPL